MKSSGRGHEDLWLLNCFCVSIFNLDLLAIGGVFLFLLGGLFHLQNKKAYTLHQSL